MLPRLAPPGVWRALRVDTLAEADAWAALEHERAVVPQVFAHSDAGAGVPSQDAAAAYTRRGGGARGSQGDAREQECRSGVGTHRRRWKVQTVRGDSRERRSKCEKPELCAAAPAVLSLPLAASRAGARARGGPRPGRGGRGRA